MADIIIEFQPWHSFRARKNDAAISSWLKKIGEASQDAFRSGMASSPSPSPPGTWPGNRKGALSRSIRYQVTGATMLEVGTNQVYSGFLRWGTKKMKDRSMSDEALEAGIKKAGRLTKWVEWSRS